MSFLLTLMGAALFALPATAQTWESLFDGNTTSGWLEVTGKPFPAHSWTIEDHCLKTVAKTDSMQDIRTTGTYRNFDLMFEWKLAKDGNSGVKYLIQRMDEWTNKDGRQARARGLEYQLVDRHSPDAKDATRLTGALYSLLAVPPGVGQYDWNIGEAFNHSRIVVQGDHVEHELNGVRVLQYEVSEPKVQAALRNLLPKGSPPETPLVREGPISLQDHSAEVWFRNIRIRRLP